jgi:hypothetical protein
VGPKEFVENMKGAYANRWRLTVAQTKSSESSKQWTIREENAACDPV